MNPTAQTAVPYEILIYSTPRDPKEKAEILVDRKAILAPTEKVANRMAARLIPDAWASRLDEVEVRVKPF